MGIALGTLGGSGAGLGVTEVGTALGVFVTRVLRGR